MAGHNLLKALNISGNAEYTLQLIKELIKADYSQFSPQPLKGTHEQVDNQN